VNQAREGPVQFEKDTGDVFNVDEFLSKVGEGSSKREYGLQEGEERVSKRARMDEDED
jgi:SNW domain-containing protein 1